MQTNLMLHPSKRHPLTGQPLQAVGVLPNGKVLWPILGGDDTVPPVDRPEGVSEEEWNALGDPGKKAIVRERDAREKAEQALAASRARPTPPAKPTVKPEPEAKPETNADPDIASIVKQAVEAAVKPLQEAEEQRVAQSAAEKVRSVVLDAAKTKLHDATDALRIDLTTVLDESGTADPAKVTAALDALVTAKPHLAKSETRFAPVGIGSSPTPSNPKERVASILAGMQSATGVRVPPTA